MPEGWNGKAPLQLSVLHTVAGSLPTPVLEQAQVMRIYIAPWIDGRNDVHWPSYIFSEVQAKRWRIGLPATRQAAEAVPYRAGASTSNAVMAGAAGGLPGKAANRAEAASAAVADALAPSTPDKGQGDLKTLTSDVPVE
jgi:conjugal transfer pilus assembly protein TraV